MENCCYNRDELLATAMARKGLFGKIVHCSGAYAHDLRGEVTGGKENRHYRLRNYLTRNCENYPTHELGPMAKVLDINRGNQMVSLVSMATLSWGMEQYVEDRRDTINPELIGADFAQGDVIHTLIKCANGETMMLKLDTSLPRSYSREFQVRGTKGLYEQDYNAVYFDGQPEFWSRVEYVEKYKNSESEKYIKKYDEEYFVDKSLAIVYVKLGCGEMVTKYLFSIIDGNSVKIKYISYSTSQICSTWNIGNLVVVEVPKVVKEIIVL